MQIGPSPHHGKRDHGSRNGQRSDHKDQEPASRHEDDGEGMGLVHQVICGYDEKQQQAGKDRLWKGMKASNTMADRNRTPVNKAPIP